MNHSTESKVDPIIDATLTHLREANPPTGLEDRLLQTLETAHQRTLNSKQTRVWVPHVSLLRHGWTTTILSPRLWLPTSLAAAALAIVFAIHLHHSAPTQTSTATTATVEAPTTAPSPQGLVILSEAQRSRRTPTLSTDVSRQNLSASAPHTSFVVIPQRSGGTCMSPAQRPCSSHANQIKQEPSTPYEQAALENTLAPSHPAPPLPLTKQERLLLRCTRRGQPIEVANLDLDRLGIPQAPTDAQEAPPLQRYVKGLLNTLVDFHPSEPTPSQDETPPTPDAPVLNDQPTTSQ